MLSTADDSIDDSLAVQSTADESIDDSPAMLSTADESIDDSLAMLSTADQGFFSKFLMGGTQNFRSPSGTDGDEVGWGGTCEKNPTKAKTAHLMQN